MSKKILVANPYERNFSRQSYLLWFGACAPTLVLAYADSLDDALEVSAECLASEGLVGFFTDSGEIHSLMLEASDELGVCADEAECHEAATRDLTHTEAGYLTSHDWGIYLEDPTKADLVRIRHERWPYS